MARVPVAAMRVSIRNPGKPGGSEYFERSVWMPELDRIVSRWPVGNVTGRSAAGRNRSKIVGTDPLCRNGAVAQMPTSVLAR